MQTSVSPASTFEPLPLRTRGVLELIDVTIKIFRRYFWVLAGWSVTVVGSSYGVAAIGMLLGAVGAGGEAFSWVDFAGTAILSIIVGGLLALFLWPLILGAAACCIAAAVRGQTVSFKQCWQFTRPRYGQILGLFMASLMVAWVAMMGYMLLCGLIIGLGALALQSVPGQVTTVLAIVAGVSFYVIGILLSLVVATWMFMVPMVPCLEGQIPSRGPLMRAWDLLRGQWRRALGLMFLLGVCLLALSFIMQAAAGLFTVFSGGRTSWSSFLSVSEGASLVVYMALNTLTSVVTMPFMFLLIAMFYLDLRIRKEALDLEWSAHVSAPQENPTDAAQLNTAPPIGSFGQRSIGAEPTAFDRPIFGPPASRDVSAPPLSNSAGSTAASSSLAHSNSPELPTHTPPSLAPTGQTRPLPVTGSDYPYGGQPQVVTSTQPGFGENTFVAEQPVVSRENSAAASTENAIESSTSAALVCPQCKAAVRQNQTFCMQCGARLATSPSTFGSPLE
ncbi:MAG TPA: hypothetical protein VF600_07855 [Abditibacteriaceae bacterium]